MKKFALITLVFILIFLLVCCKEKNKENEDLLYLGLNCQIDDLDLVKNTIVLSGLDETAIEQIGSMAKFDLKDSDIFKLENSEPVFITLDKLKKGDHVAINIYKSEINALGENDLPKIKSIEVLD